MVKDDTNETATPIGPRAAEQLAAFVGVMRLQDQLNREVANFLKPFQLTGPQYNVLRILRGAGEKGLSCRQIGRRMLTRVPDITRLVDRLEKAGMAERIAHPDDRRVVLVRVTATALKLLTQLDPSTRTLLQDQFAALRDSEIGELRRLIELMLAGSRDDPTQNRAQQAHAHSGEGVDDDSTP
jgi:DNA-binding MarR family transcriptional regulator